MVKVLSHCFGCMRCVHVRMCVCQCICKLRVFFSWHSMMIVCGHCSSLYLAALNSSEVCKGRGDSCRDALASQER